MSKQTTITVPRDNVNNSGVCEVVENYLSKIFRETPDDAYHTNDLIRKVNKKFGNTYGTLDYHVVRALDQFFANRVIKRVAPSIFQSVNGPDDEYSERASGHVPEGQPYDKRPGNFTNNPTVPSARSKAIFNADMRKVQSSIKILQRCDMDADTMQTKMLETGKFNPVAVKYCINQLKEAA